MRSEFNGAPLGALLRQYREQRGLSQEALAELAGPGLSVNTIGNIERGRTRPYRHTVESLCQALRLAAGEQAEVLAAWQACQPEEPRRGDVDAPPPALLPWLPVTKFSPPVPRPDTVPRARLTAALRQDLEQYRLVLLSAPAGSGKTTLLASALEAIPFHSVWVALDEEDNDPARFLAVLVVASRRLGSRVGASAERLLTTLPSPATRARQIVGALINDLATVSHPVTLVLDDLHRLTEPAIFVALDYLIDRLPSSAHLVVATRHDPPVGLARLRARDELTEIRFTDLRFTPEETALFLNQRHELGIASAELAVVQQRTEGWAAGLRLVAGALDRLPSVPEREALLAGLARADRQMFHFLAEEVLRHEEEETRRFLLETSIQRRLTASLCRHVTGQQNAPSLLEDLAQRNLFIAALEETVGQETVFRYHDLFAAFLRQQLEREMPERVAELHRRAAEASPVPTEAIGYYLAGSWWEEAADRIEKVGPALLEQGLIHTVRGWIEQLPTSVYQSRPRLLYLLGLCKFRQHQIAEARASLEEAVRGFEEQGEAAAQGKALTYLTTAAFLQGDLRGAHTLTERALELPLDEADRVRALLLHARGNMVLGQVSAAAGDFEAAMQVAETTVGKRVLATLVTALEPTVYIVPEGGIARVERALRRASDGLGQERGPVLTTMEAQRTVLHLWRGRVDDALDAAERWLSLREQYGSENPVLDLFPVGGLAAVHAMRGDYTAAHRYLEMMGQQYQSHDPVDRYPPAGIYLRGRFFLFEGRYPEAREAYRQMLSIQETGMMIALRERLLGLLHVAEGSHVEAERVLNRATDIQEQIPSSILFGDARLLLAQFYLCTGQQHRALATLAPVLEKHEMEDTVGLFLWECRPLIPLLRLALKHGMRTSFTLRVLDLLESPARDQPLIVPAIGEMLSAREIELLRLLAAGASNREIAEQLVIGESTVKTHVSHILRKLDVSSRTQAAARARDLQLI